ncbi:MAG: hypothetical protein LBM95_06710 [Lactobacillales bacterium]|nr:hypothetical protein [Lactobacillales bacterium]
MLIKGATQGISLLALRKLRGNGKGNGLDLLTSDELVRYRQLEAVVIGLLDMNQVYDRVIKQSVLSTIQKGV